MATDIQDPFRPGYAVAPRFLAGRESVRQRCRSLLASLSIPGYGTPRSVVLFGPRGNGKTSLLVEAGFPAWARELASEEGEQPPFQHLHIDNGYDVSVEIGTRAGVTAQRLLREGATGRQRSRFHRLAGLGASLGLTPEGGLSVAVSMPTGGEAQAPDLQDSLSLKQQLQLLLLEGPLLLTIDEAYGMEPAYAARLLSAVGALCAESEGEAQAAPPSILLVLAGTPELRRWLRNLRTRSHPRFGATFWDRCEKVPLGRLESPDAAVALALPLKSVGMSIDEETLQAAVNEAQGYPFFLQHLGSAMFEAAQHHGVMHVHDEHLAEALSILARIRTDYYGEREVELETLGLSSIASQIGNVVLTSPRQRLSTPSVHREMARILTAELGGDMMAWEDMTQVLKHRDPGSAFLRRVETRLAALERRGLPLEGAHLAHVAGQAAIAVVEQLGDLGFLWAAQTAGDVELGIPSLASHLVERRAERDAADPALSPDPTSGR